MNDGAVLRTSIARRADQGLVQAKPDVSRGDAQIMAVRVSGWMSGKNVLGERREARQYQKASWLSRP